MDRRRFFQGSLAGFAGIPVLTDTSTQSLAKALAEAELGAPTAGADQVASNGTSTLFPTNLPSKEWMQFEAHGFSKSARGVIYWRGDTVVRGVPLGGISTGFIDVEPNGTFGPYSLFNSGVPVGGPLRSPFLGVNVEGVKSWVMTLDEMVAVENAKQIHYWGHYPVVDMEYESRAPVKVGLRAWAPFIPGDVLASNVPAAIFEVRLRNTTSGDIRIILTLTAVWLDRSPPHSTRAIANR